MIFTNSNMTFIFIDDISSDVCNLSYDLFEKSNNSYDFSDIEYSGILV